MNKFRKTLPPLSSLLPFEATARLGSVTRAAEELGLTQAAVSRQIKVLEDNLGTALFNRRNRAVFLTKQGRELKKSVSAALEELSVCALNLRAPQNNNTIVLFAQLCEGLYWLMPKLSSFYQRHQNIEVNVSVSTNTVTQESRYFDLVMQTSGREYGDYELIFTAPDEVFPVCSPKYMENYSYPLSISDLSDHHLLHHKIYPQDWVDWDGWLKQLNTKKCVGFNGTVYDSYPMMMQSAIEGHGIALGWKQTTDQLIKSGQLMRPFQLSLTLPDGLSVYLHPNCKRRAELEIFIKWLQSELGKA